MSYTTVLAIYPGEKVEKIEELRNAFGSAPYVWNVLCQRYYDTEDGGWIIGNTLNTLWPRWKDISIPEHQRAVLMMTYDRAYVAKKDYARATKDIRQFLMDFPPAPTHVNHWAHIASLFDADHPYPGIGFHMTSVSENPFRGLWNEEKEAYDSPDWSQTYDLYNQLDHVSSQA